MNTRANASLAARRGGRFPRGVPTGLRILSTRGGGRRRCILGGAVAPLGPGWARGMPAGAELIQNTRNDIAKTLKPSTFVPTVMHVDEHATGALQRVEHPIHILGFSVKEHDLHR